MNRLVLQVFKSHGKVWFHVVLPEIAVVITVRLNHVSAKVVATILRLVVETLQQDSFTQCFHVVAGYHNLQIATLGSLNKRENGR